jgi:hypothetical protein
MTGRFVRALELTKCIFAKDPSFIGTDNTIPTVIQVEARDAGDLFYPTSRIETVADQRPFWMAGRVKIITTTEIWIGQCREPYPVSF